MRYLPSILSGVMLSCSAAQAGAKDLVRYWSGVYCYHEDSAQYIARRLISDVMDEVRENERARIALAIVGGMQKVVVIVNLSSDHPYLRVPVCFCAARKVHVPKSRPKGEVNQRGHVVHAREYFKNEHFGGAQQMRKYVYVGGSHVVCLPEPNESVHARTK